MRSGKPFGTLGGLLPGMPNRLIFGVLATAIIGPALFAQATEGSILGTVTDSSGGAVVGAHIRLTGVDTGLARTTNSNLVGEYLVANLPPGSYKVIAEMTGFKRSEQPAVELTLKARVRVDLRMEVAKSARRWRSPARRLC